MGRALDLSVVVVNWNTRDLLRDCLGSLFAETRDIDFEVFVVDNASEDGSVAMVEREFPSVRIVVNHKNLGFAAANNLALERARGRYVLLLNSDTIVLDGALQKTVRVADERPRAGVLGCRILNPDRSLQPSCFQDHRLSNLVLYMTHLRALFPASRVFGKERMGWWNHADERDVEVVTGAFMLVRKETIDEVGGLDEQFFMYCEETDWCRRIRQAGWKVLFTPEAQIVHLKGGSSQTSEAMFRQIHGSILLYIRKHRARSYYFVCAATMGLAFALRIPAWVAVAAVQNGEARVRAQAQVSRHARALASLLISGPSGLCVPRTAR